MSISTNRPRLFVPISLGILVSRSLGRAHNGSKTGGHNDSLALGFTLCREQGVAGSFQSGLDQLDHRVGHVFREERRGHVDKAVAAFNKLVVAAFLLHIGDDAVGECALAPELGQSGLEFLALFRVADDSDD